MTAAGRDWFADNHEHDRADVAVLAVGDTVRVGGGTRHWTITDFWTSPQGEPMASMSPAGGGYTNTSTSIHRLTLVERATDALPYSTEEACS